MVVQLKTSAETAPTGAKKRTLKKKGAKKPSTRDTLNKATLSKKNSSAKSSSKTKTLQKTRSIKKAVPPKSKINKKAAPKKAALTKATQAKNAAKKSTLELLNAIKARDLETHKTAKSKSTGTKKAPSLKKSASRTRPRKAKPLPIVPPMQEALEIVVPASVKRKNKRRASFKKKDLDQFRCDLLIMRDHFTGQTDSMKHDALQRDDEVNPEEDGTDAFMRLQALNQMNDQQHIVADIDNALAAIDKGTYGGCEICDCLISKPRLKARPFAKFCIKCKSDMERANRFKKIR